MALTIWGGPEKADRTALGDLEGFDLPDVVRQVHGIGMVGLVHAEGFAIVIDREVRGSAEGFLDSSRRATTASEAVDDQATENMIEILRRKKIVIAEVIHRI